MSAAAQALASGKGHRDENFPVASWVLAPRHRPPIMAFYRFARLADDIADNPAATAADKLALLGAMRADIETGSANVPEAAALATVHTRYGLDTAHACDLLSAFEADAANLPTPDWDALLSYCRMSAMPVGRFVLDVHGEDRATWGASDALCAALQIINHLQDCGKDWRAMARVYLPADMLAAHGARAEDLARDAATPALRAVIDEALTRTDALMAQAAPFAAMIRDRRLAAEVAAIHGLAASLVARLKRRDPLSMRVVHRKPEMAGIAARAVWRHFWRRAA